MNSLQEKVKIAFTCRRVLQCLKEKLRHMSSESKTEASDEFLHLMRDVAAIVGDDTVLRAVQHCDADRIRLLVEEKEFRSHLNIPVLKHEVKEVDDDNLAELENVDEDYQLDDQLCPFSVLGNNYTDIRSTLNDEVELPPTQPPLTVLVSPNRDQDKRQTLNDEVDLDESMLDVKEEHAPHAVAMDEFVNIPTVKRKALSNESADRGQTNSPVGEDESNDHEVVLNKEEADLNESLLDFKEEQASLAVGTDLHFQIPTLKRKTISNGSTGRRQTFPTANLPFLRNKNIEPQSATNEEVDLNKRMYNVEEEYAAATMSADIPIVKREAISNGSAVSDRTLPPAKVPQVVRATSLATTVDLFSQEDCTSQPALSQESVASDHVANILAEDILDSLDESVHIDHMNDIQQRRVVYKSPCFYEVLSGGESQSVYYIMPGINYCYCDRFQIEVLDKHTEYTCIHVMAAWMAEALGACRIAPTTTEKLAIITKLIEERTMHYH